MAVIKRIGDILIENGMITPDQLSDALDKKLPGERVGQALVRLKYISEGQILKVLDNFKKRTLYLSPRSAN